MLDELLRRVSNHTPRTLETDGRFPEAAVLVPITRSDEPELILTLRASGLSTHGGEVAFPGGRRDPEDPDLIFTALREAEEEIGLPPGDRKSTRLNSSHTVIYTLSLHDALPISWRRSRLPRRATRPRRP